MKWIDKQEAPPSFIRCIKKKRPQNWDEFTKNHLQVKKKLACQLLLEQGFLCCYCEQRIGVGISHIEHMRPKGKPPTLTFDYQICFRVVATRIVAAFTEVKTVIGFPIIW